MNGNDSTRNRVPAERTTSNHESISAGDHHQTIAAPARPKAKNISKRGHGCFKTAGIAGVCLATTPPTLTAVIAGVMARNSDNPTATAIAAVATLIALTTAIGLSVIVHKAIRKNRAAMMNNQNSE